MGSITINGRARRSVLGGHPWVYSDNVTDAAGDAGELLPVHGPDGAVLGWGVYSTASKISVRIVTRADAQPNRDFWVERIRSAVDTRRTLGFLDPANPRGACRLIAGDADGIPGLVIDRYADTLVIQSGCQASDRMRDFLLEILLEVLEESGTGNIATVFDRSDTGVRKQEQLEPRIEWLRGERGSVQVEEPEKNGVPALVYTVDVTGGHKTGHYLDQVENRRLAASFAPGKRVLDVFSYDGLFGIRAALAGAAEVVCVDQSEAAGERCSANIEQNNVGDRVRFERGKAMNDLRDRAAAGEIYDLVVVDPPAFARNRREVDAAERGYRELNRRAMALVSPAGILVTASCSHAMGRERFHGCLAAASAISGRRVSLIHSRGAGADHPVRLDLPETEYLKCSFLHLD